MSKILLCVFLCLISGCAIIEYPLTDIEGWDLSACVEYPEACYELFTDNQEKILDGKTIDELIWEWLQQNPESQPAI